MNTIERAPRQARPRRRAMRIVGAVCVVALVATAAYVAWSRENARPQPYGGAATANDQLIRVVTDPSGGAWAIGIHYDRPLAENGVQAVSTFIIHDAQGRWSMSKSLDITTGEYIDNLAMVSADEGWAIGGVNGNNGLILHYQHGAWSEESYHPLGELLGIAMVSPTEGWVVGGWSGENPQTGQSNVMTLLHYHDGTWTRVPSPAAGPFQAVAMSSAVAGWAAGATGPTPQPPLLRYADGVWAPAPIASASLSTTASPPDVIGALAAPSASVAWAVGANGLMLRYRNGAWARVGSPTTASLTGISMTSATDGWAVGDPYDTHASVILHARDGVWTQVKSPTQQPLTSVAMLSANEGWAVGAGGTILHYIGGAWSVVNGG